MGENGWQADAVSVYYSLVQCEQVRVCGSALFDLDIWVGWGGETDSNKELKNQLQLA